jgi:hypothetical protein
MEQSWRLWHLNEFLKRFRPTLVDYEKCIRELCSKVLTANNEQFEDAMAELRVAIREHSLATENRFYSYPVLKRDPELISD